jgi:hypothetical protein
VIFAGRAERKIDGRSKKFTDDEMLNALRRLWREHGYINRTLIDKSDGVPCASRYHVRFGGIRPTYRLIGYARGAGGRCKGTTPGGRPCGLSDKEMLAAVRRLLRERGALSRRIIDASRAVPSNGTFYARFGSLRRAYELIEYTPRRN